MLVGVRSFYAHKTIGLQVVTGMREMMMVFSCCVVAAALFCTGCTNPSGFPGMNVVTAEPTNEPGPLPTMAPLSTPVLPVTTQATYHTIIPPGTPAYISTVTQYPQPVYHSPSYPVTPPSGPEPSDPASIVFLHYSDQNFAVDYPSSWNITRAGNVGFRSASGRVEFIAEISDFLPGYEGNIRLNPDIAGVQEMVTREFPGYNAQNIIYNYQNTVINGVPATEYSVRIPDGPVAYRRYLFVTLHHGYQFTFTSDPATFDEEAPLREYMFGTLVLHDQA
jgi:hypothetical protein